MPALKKTRQASKKKISTGRAELLPQPTLSKTSIEWQDAYPCLKQVYKIQKETVEVYKYYNAMDRDFNDFLFQVIRAPSSWPPFIKTNLKKIRKMIEKEIKHRDKVYEAMSKEQVSAFQSYFKDEMYFERDNTDEYFEHELEKTYFNFLKAYLDTRLYESKTRSLNKKRTTTLNKYGINGRL